jgi:hypothetical protein
LKRGLDVVRQCIFGEKPDRAGVKGPPDFLFRVREHDDLRRGCTLSQLRDDIGAVAIRQPYVQQHDIEVARTHLLQYFSGGARFRGDAHVRIVAQEAAYPTANDNVIVSDEDCDHVVRFGCQCERTAITWKRTNSLTALGAVERKLDDVRGFRLIGAMRGLGSRHHEISKHLDIKRLADNRMDEPAIEALGRRGRCAHHDDDRLAACLLFHVGEHGHPRHSRHHEIQDEHVVCAGAKHRDRYVAVVRYINGAAFSLENLGDESPDRPVILDHENARCRHSSTSCNDLTNELAKRFNSAPNLPVLLARRPRPRTLIVEDHVEERTVNLKAAVVVDKPEVSKAVHEEIHP